MKLLFSRYWSRGSMQQIRIPSLVRIETIAVMFLLLALPAVSHADGINGYMEYVYGLSDFKTTDSSGTTTTKSKNLTQRYNLEINKDLTSTLRMAMGANAQLGDTTSDVNGVSSDSSTMRVSPHFDLTYSNGFFSGSGSFSRRIDSSKSNGVTTPDLYSDTYSGRLSWIPHEDFPNLNLLYSVFNNYDENRSTQDITSTSLTFSSHYRPLHTLDLNYSGNHSTTTNQLSGFESETLTQSMRADYNDLFLQGRVLVSSSYNISTQQNTITRKNGSGSNLAPPRSVVVDPVYLVTTTTGGINSVPDFSTDTFKTSNPLPNTVVILQPTVPPASNLINLGMQISSLNSDSNMNIVRLPVSTTAANNHELTSADFTTIATVYSNAFKVYGSNTGHDDWQTLPVSQFVFNNTFTYRDGVKTDPAFELHLTSTSTYKYIWVEVVPVSGNSDTRLQTILQKMIITKLETYFEDRNTTFAVGSSTSSSQVSGTYNLNMKARLWDVPNLSFDSGLDLNHSKTDTSSFKYRYSLVNGLSLNHVLSPILSVNARLARQDDVNPPENKNSYANSFSVSLAATPLPTLSSLVNYSFRQEKSDAGLSRTTNAVNMSNSAELYRGINLGLNLGGNMASDSNGKEQQSVLGNISLNLIPNRAVSINLGVSDNETWQSGGDTRDDNKSSSNRSFNSSISYSPVPAIYLFGSLDVSMQTHLGTQTTKSIGGSWSPFKGGALQLNTSYLESYQPDGTKSRTINESLHLVIRPGAYLDLSYMIQKTDGAGQTNDVNSLSATLRISF